MRKEALKLAQEPVAVDITIDDDDALSYLRDMVVQSNGELTPIRLLVGEGHSGYGLYIASVDYPEEGAVKIADVTVSKTATQAKAEQEKGSTPEDPMDTQLPCDVTVGHVNIRKGVALRTLVARMQVLYDMAQATQSQGEPVARVAELEETVRQLNHALREATEAPTFMGEPAIESQQFAARIKGVDEYGPMLEWSTHWVKFPIGTKFYTTPQQRKPLTDECCTWKNYDDFNMPDTWEADCGEMWTFTEGGPKDNDMKFCPNCGKPTIEAAHGIKE